MSRRTGRPTLVASGTKRNPEPKSDDLLLDLFTDMVNDASRDGVAALDVVGDLLLENQKTLAWASSASIGTGADVEGAFVLMHDGGMWESGSRPPLIQWGASWHVRSQLSYGETLWYPEVLWYVDNMEIQASLLRHRVPLYQSDKRATLNDAVRLAWAGTRLLADILAGKVRPLISLPAEHGEEMTGTPIDSVRSADWNVAIDEIRVRLQQAAWEKVPSELATGLGTHFFLGTPKKNSARPKEEAIAEFKRLVQDPDPHALDVALDVLEQSGVPLADVGSGWDESRIPSIPSGEWFLIDGHPKAAGTKLGRTGVQWLVQPYWPQRRGGIAYSPRIDWVINGVPWPEATRLMSPSFRLREEHAISDALAIAWAGTKILRDLINEDRLSDVNDVRTKLKFAVLYPSKDTHGLFKRNPVGEEWEEMEMQVRDVVEDMPELAQYEPEVMAGLSPRGAEYLVEINRTDVQHRLERFVWIVLRKPPRDDSDAPLENDELKKIAKAMQRVVQTVNDRWPLPGSVWKASPWRWGDIEAKEYLLERVPAARKNPHGAAPSPGHYREIQFAGPRIRVTDTDGRDETYQMAAPTEHEIAAQTFTFLQHDPAGDLDGTEYLDQYFNIGYGGINVTYDLMGYQETTLTAIYQMLFPDAVPQENPARALKRNAPPGNRGPQPGVYAQEILRSEFEVGTTVDYIWMIFSPGEAELVNDDNLAQYGFWEDGTLHYVANLVGYTDAELQEIYAELQSYAAQQNQGNAMANNPAGCKPCSPKRTFKANPPSWVTKHLADSWVTLEGMVPPSWMPKLDKTISKGRKLTAEIPEYGCGVYGCVMPTLDPKVVLKVTTDDTEAQFAARLAKKMPPHTVTKYELAIELPEATHKKRKVYLLWRESADNVGEVNKVLGSKAEALVDKQHQAAQVALAAAWSLEPGDNPRELQEALGTWLASLDEMGGIPALASLADGMRRAFMQSYVFFGDVHGGNMGLASGNWVITDPGNVVVVDDKTAKAASALYDEWRRG